MLRRLYTMTAAISLLLFVATVALWVRSYWVEDALDRLAPGKNFGLSSGRGQIVFDQAVNPPEVQALIAPVPPRALSRWRYSKSGPRAPIAAGDKTWLGRAGVSIMWRERMPMYAFSNSLLFEVQTRVVIPHWLLAGVLGVLPTFALLRLIRRRRRADATSPRCRSCGYDLRATPERCPECGAVAATSSAPVTARSWS